MELNIKGDAVVLSDSYRIEYSETSGTGELFQMTPKGEKFIKTSGRREQLRMTDGGIKHQRERSCFECQL